MYKVQMQHVNKSLSSISVYKKLVFHFLENPVIDVLRDRVYDCVVYAINNVC